MRPLKTVSDTRHTAVTYKEGVFSASDEELSFLLKKKPEVPLNKNSPQQLVTHTTTVTPQHGTSPTSFVTFGSSWGAKAATLR